MLLLGIMIVSEIKALPAGSSIAGVILGLVLPALGKYIQDLSDNTEWKASQRRLKRGGFIKDDDIIRISFAYLYRIKVGNKYLLVRNTRNTGKYQPVGGVYKLQGKEKAILKNQFHVIDDNKIRSDKLSRDDYRIRMENRYLRKFMKRFDNPKAERERLEDVSREFREEMIDTGILNWDSINYRVCGRHMTELRFEEHFQIYELLLADIVELQPTSDQERDLANLMRVDSEKYRFATADQIRCLGVDTEAGELKEWIGDHTKNVLQENEGKLLTLQQTGKSYTLSLISQNRQ